MRASAPAQPTIGPVRLPRSRKRRRLRVGFSLALICAVVGLVLWLLTRFDPFDRAAAAYDRHQYRAALQVAQNHLKWFPSNRRASLLAARCLMRLSRAAEAEAHYVKAAPLDLADAEVRAYNLVNLNKPHEAALAYDDLLKRWPEDALALKRLAAVRMGLGQWRDVLKLADRLIAIPKEEIAGQTMAGIAHHELKHYNQAVISCLRVLELDPDLERMPLPRTLFWNNLCLDLIAGGQTDEARGYLTRALADCQDAGLMELLGLTYFQQGSIDEAERCWQKAESWDPKNADVCLDLGRLALNRRRWSEAVGLLKRAAASSADAVEPLYNLSQAYRMLGNAEEAERCQRLADQRRKTQPQQATGMGVDADPAGARAGIRDGSSEGVR
jgi:Flp pilus assembly protein TadD